MSHNLKRLSEFKVACQQLVEKGQGVFHWEWDDRFQAALSTVGASSNQQVRSWLSAHFPLNWNAATVAEASPYILDFTNALGGLRGNQELFVTDADAPPMLIGAWWPWGDGQTTSLRLMIEMGDVSVGQSVLDEFRRWFKL